MRILIPSDLIVMTSNQIAQIRHITTNHITSHRCIAYTPATENVLARDENPYARALTFERIEIY